MAPPKRDAAHQAVLRASRGKITADQLRAELEALVEGQPAGTGKTLAEYASSVSLGGGAVG